MSSWTDIEAEPQAEPLDLRGRLADHLAWRPEWPAVVVIAAAWLFLALGGDHGVLAEASMSDTHSMPGMAASPMPMTPATWAAMSVAMMLPLALPVLRHVSFNTMRGRRQVSMLLFSIGFVLPWLALGAVVLPVAALLLAEGVDVVVAAAVVLVVAGLWQLSSYKRFAVLSCSRTVPLPPSGWRSFTNPVEYGVRQALRCAAACWPVMLLMPFLPHGPGGLLAMAALTAMMLAEMQSRHRRRLLPLFAVPLAAASLAVWVVVGVGA